MQCGNWLSVRIVLADMILGAGALKAQLLNATEFEWFHIK